MSNVTDDVGAVTSGRMDVTFTAAYLKKILIIAYLEQVANGAKKVAFILSFFHVHRSFHINCLVNHSHTSHRKASDYD